MVRNCIECVHLLLKDRVFDAAQFDPFDCSLFENLLRNLPGIVGSREGSLERRLIDLCSAFLLPNF